MSMYKLLGTDMLKGLVKFSDVRIDNIVFRMHYKYTTTLLIGCSLLVSATQFFGEPIHCVTNDPTSAGIMSSYCWVEGTITLPRSLNATPGKDVIAPGVDRRRIGENEEVIEHAYYQWVYFFLFFQALMFYFPRLLWRIWESGRLKEIVKGLSAPIVDKEEYNKQINIVVKHFMNYRFLYKTYAVKFLFCEILNLLNVIWQIYFVHIFLGFQFSDYGSSVLWYVSQDPEDRVDPMAKVFPKVTKCRFRKFGTDGEVMNQDAMCVLALNILNEKIFVLFWFWFIILAIITAVTVIYRLALIAFPPSHRGRLVKFTSSTMSQDKLIPLADSGTYGDVFIMMCVKNNCKAYKFNDVCDRVCKKLTGKPEEQMELLSSGV